MATLAANTSPGELPVCHDQAMLAIDRWRDDVSVQSSGPRMVCTVCEIIGADARPNWSERPVRPSLTGWQWAKSRAQK